MALLTHEHAVLVHHVVCARRELRPADALDDAASFVVMRHRRLDQVLAFDQHTEAEGFTLRN